MLQRSTIAHRVETANLSGGDSNKRLWGVAATIGCILVSVNCLAYVVTEYGMFGGRSEYFTTTTAAGTCMHELKQSNFDLMDTHNYHKWMGMFIACFDCD